MLRPVVAFLMLCLAAFLLAPTVASVHRMVEDLDIDRDTGIELFKWYDNPSPPEWPDCGGSPRHLYSEITQWPDKIRKDEAFTLRGVVQSEEEGRKGVAQINVDIFMNETKTEPGVLLGSTESGPGGFFELLTSVPFDLQASHYHIVAHAKKERIGCQTYLEHWSDPEVDVVSETRIEWDAPDHPVAGHSMDLTGRVVDSVGGPVRNATLEVVLDGKEHEVVTDEEGAFTIAYRPGQPGRVEVSADYDGSDYYGASSNETAFEVAEELFELDGEPLTVVRGQPFTLTGRVFVADDARKDALTIDLDGVNASTCAGCPVDDTFEAPIAEDGSFSLALAIPSSESPGVYRLDVLGGGLKEGHTTDLTVEVVPILVVEADGTGFFTRDYAGRATLADEAGRPIQGAEIALVTPEGWATNATDQGGAVVFSGKADACGVRSVQAFYNGSSHVRRADAADDVNVCGFLAFIPPWLLAVPWWIWPLVALAAYASWRAVRAWRERYAPIITGGPALTLTFTQPADEAMGYATVGEEVVATAFLEEPLPDGHHLRMGTFRAAEEVAIDSELRAHLRIVPEKLGPVGVRAEIVDPKGRVVSRRTLALRVVRYAEEIERRYLALRAGSGAGDAVTPREFERWLRERAPALDADVLRRLVHVFEEADYSPRVAGRPEFAAYLAAEGGVQEVTPDAPLA